MRQVVWNWAYVYVVVSSIGASLPNAAIVLHEYVGRHPNKEVGLVVCFSADANNDGSASDTQQCAKILTGILPLLYWSLKYLRYMCDKGGWKDKKIEEKFTISGNLGFFLNYAGFKVDKSSGDLDNNKTGSSITTLLTFVDNDLKKLYDCACKHFTTQRSISQPQAQASKPGSSSSSTTSKSSGPKKPSTVREMMFWLGGLPFCGCYRQLESYIKQRCDDCGASGFYDQICILTCLCSAQCHRVLCAIQGKTHNFYDYHCPQDCRYFYPSNPQECFDMLCCYVRPIYFVLTFLRIQCDFQATNGAWFHCQFGKDVDADKGSAADDKHKNSNGSGGNECKCHPKQNLQAFLTDQSDFKYKCSKDSEPIQMGFTAENLPDDKKKGNDLHNVMWNLAASSCPLNSLCEYLMCVSCRPPCTLGEIADFFSTIPQRLQGVGAAIKKDIEDEPGTYAAATLIDAFKAVSGNSGHTDPKHPNDLQSIMTCAGQDTCGKYLFPIMDKIYWSYSNKCSRTYLSWLFHLAFELRSQLRSLEDEFRKCQCCKTSSGSQDSSSSCENIAECKSGHPLFFKYGFTFWSPASLSGKNSDGEEEKDEAKKKGKRTCSDFLTQLGKVLGKDAPLANYIAECERFLWSIRLPFTIALLAAWAAVVLYWTYVHLLRL